MAGEALYDIADSCNRYTDAFNAWLASGKDVYDESLAAVGVAIDDLTNTLAKALEDADSDEGR